MKPVIGIDFDNTIISYDELLKKLAVERGLVTGGSNFSSKQAIRDEIRRRPDGEKDWMKLQALAYGQLIGEAKLFEGVIDFLKECRRRGVEVYVISHKSEFPAADPTINLRTAALSFIKAQNFFDPNGLNFDPSKHVFFETTREGKLNRIKMLGCTWFIDDLQETLVEKNFPKNVGRILFSPSGELAPLPEIRVMKSWKEIRDFFFAR